jgi:hypothetical protein
MYGTLRDIFYVLEGVHAYEISEIKFREEGRTKKGAKLSDLS